MMLKTQALAPLRQQRRALDVRCQAQGPPPPNNNSSKLATGAAMAGVG
jgi:hypothetical protein